MHINTKAWRYHQLGMTSRFIKSGHLDEYGANVECWSLGFIKSSNRRPQPSGSPSPPTRVATHGEQVAPFSRLLRHAMGCKGPIVVTPGHHGVLGVEKNKWYDMIWYMLNTVWKKCYSFKDAIGDGYVTCNNIHNTWPKLFCDEIKILTFSFSMTKIKYQ